MARPRRKAPIPIAPATRSPATFSLTPRKPSICSMVSWGLFRIAAAAPRRNSASKIGAIAVAVR